MALGLGNTFDVSVKFLADLESYIQGIEKGSRKIEQFGKRVQKVGKNLTRNLTLPIIALGAATVNASLKMNTAMANVETLIPGMTERVIELKREIQDLGIETGKATSEMTAGLYEVISAFGDTEETMARLEANARLAVAGFSSVAQAVNFTSAATKGFGDISAKAIQNASDLGLLTVRLGKTSFPELSGSIGKLTGNAKALNISLEELMAMYATLTGVTGDTAKVTTQIEAAMRAFIKPTEGMTEAIKELGFAGSEALIGEKGLAGALRAVLSTTDGAVESLGKLVESSEAFPLILGIAGAQADVFDDKLNQMNDSLGTTDEAVKAATEGINKAGHRWDQFKVKLVVMAERLGDTLIPAFTKLLNDLLIPFLNKVGEWIKKFTELDTSTQKLILTLVALAAGLGPVLTVIGSIIKVMPVLKIAILAVTTAMAGPLGLIAVISAAAIAFGVTLKNKIDAANSTLISFGDTAVGQADRIGVAFTDMYQNVSDAVFNMTADIIYNVKAVTEALAFLGVVGKPGKPILRTFLTPEEMAEQVRQTFNVINVLEAAGKITGEGAGEMRQAIKDAGFEAAKTIMLALAGAFGDLSVEDILKIAPKGPPGPLRPGVSLGGKITAEDQARLDRWIKRSDELIEFWNAVSDRARELSRQIEFQVKAPRPARDDPFTGAEKEIFAEAKNIVAELGYPWAQALLYASNGYTVQDLRDLGMVFPGDEGFGISGPGAVVEKKGEKTANLIKDMFMSISDTILDAAELLGKSIVSGDIASALTNIFSMIGNAISEKISTMITTSIGGGGLFSSIVGAFGGGLVSGLFGLVGGLFSGRDDRGSSESSPVFVSAFISNWEQFFQFGTTLPVSFVYSGRIGGYNVDPHGRTISGWSTGQHFDA